MCTVVILVVGTWVTWFIPSFIAIYAICVLLGACSAFTMPAAAAYVPLVFKKSLLQQANSVAMLAVQLGMIIGPISATLLLGLVDENDTSHLSIPIMLCACAICYIFAFAFSLRISNVSIDDPASQGEGIKKKLGAAISYLRHDHSVRQIFIYVSLVALLINGPIEVLLPVFVADELLGSPNVFGFLLAALSAGTLIGMIASAGVKLKFSAGTVLLASDIIAAALLVVMALANSVIVSIVVMLIIGLAIGLAQVIYISGIQNRIPDKEIGSVMSIFQLSAFAGRPLAAMVTGYLLGFSASTTIMLALGLSLLLLASLAFLQSDITSIKQAVN